MDNKNNYNRSKEFNNFSFSPFAIMENIALWQQQSATAWMEIYKEFAAYSQKISESWSSAIWKTWTGKEGLQSKENDVSFQSHIDNNTNKNSKKKMRALVLKEEEHLERFKLVLSKHYMKRLQEKTKKMEMKKDHYLTLLRGLQLVQ
jgi:hypothetical protein